MKLAIIGSGEMAQELFNLIISCNKKDEYDKVIFVDLSEDKKRDVILEEEFFTVDRGEYEILIAMGEPEMRKRMFEKYTCQGFRFATFVHPLSYISTGTTLDCGCIVLPFVYVAQNTHIGKNVLLHAGSKIENDCNVGDNSFVSCDAFIGAKTTVGNTCFIGPGALLRDSIEIGKGSIIGMGSVVTKSVEDYSVCYGNPAKRYRENEKHQVFK